MAEAQTRIVHAQVATALGQISLVRDRSLADNEHMGRTPVYHLQLSLLHFPEHGRGCFPEDWGTNRFERIGQLFLLPAGHVFRARTTCPEQSSIVYHFAAEALEKWFEEGIQWNVPQLEHSLALADPEVRRLMVRIGQELRNPGFASEAVIELMAGEVLIALARQLRKVERPSLQGGLSPWRLRLIDDYLDEHSARASLTDLAQLCQLSVRQLSRAFRLSRGCSLGAYIAQYRMEEARRWLASGLPVKEVARHVGFNSTSNFSAAFRRLTGETPRASILRAPQ
jgi:AraC family transcriptional regulator